MVRSEEDVDSIVPLQDPGGFCACVQRTESDSRRQVERGIAQWR